MSGICVISATRSTVDRFLGQTVVVFAEPPMRYICTFDDDGKMVHAADSIRILGRIDEFETVYQKYLKQETMVDKNKPKFEPKEVSDVMLTFPGDVSEYLPSVSEIPKDFWEQCHPTCALTENIAYGCYKGSQIGFRTRGGINGELVWRHILACLRSFEPKHEHKIAGVAYLFNEWIDVFYIDDKVVWYNKDRVDLETLERTPDE